MSDTITAGTVVHLVGRRRRYVVTLVHRYGSGLRLQWDVFELLAISGGEHESWPNGKPLTALVRDADQTISFTGARARRRMSNYTDRVENHRGLAGRRLMQQHVRGQILGVAPPVDLAQVLVQLDRGIAANEVDAAGAPVAEAL